LIAFFITTLCAVCEEYASGRSHCGERWKADPLKMFMTKMDFIRHMLTEDGSRFLAGQPVNKNTILRSYATPILLTQHS
jgi:hypothetical protein